MRHTRRAFSGFFLCALGIWAVLSALLWVSCVYVGVPLWRPALAITLLALAIAVVVINERRHELLPEGFEFVGSHLITPDGVFCDQCHVRSQIDERIPKRKRKGYVYIYRCPLCERSEYIDGAKIDKGDEV